MNFDLIIFGGGTAGIAAAYISSKYGLKTLLVEKTNVLGGAITQGLVIPSMKVNSEEINTEFFNDLKDFADKYKARHTYLDGNEAWFNPELLKIALDNMLDTVNCSVLFDTQPVKIEYINNNSSFNVKLDHKALSLYIDSNYIVDATGYGKIFQLLDCEFQNDLEKKQTPSLRFIMGNVNLEKFSKWLLQIDKDRNVTTVQSTNNFIHLSTAYTWDKSKNWALTPIFEKAISNKDLTTEDAAYFQVFTVANMKDSVAFNCPRILLDENADTSNPFIYSKALRQGRERIYRIANFCKKYLVGFENSAITHISDQLGERETKRIKGKYTITKDDILSSKKFKNTILACDYPIDIHSNKNKDDKLEHFKRTYHLPLDCLISEKYDNLYGIGKILSADFEAQAALRTQISCFSMGEAAAKDIINKINKQKKR